MPLWEICPTWYSSLVCLSVCMLCPQTFKAAVYSCCQNFFVYCIYVCVCVLMSILLSTSFFLLRFPPTHLMSSFWCLCVLKMIFSISKFLSFSYCTICLALLICGIPLCHCYGFFSFFVCFCRSLTSNLPNVNLPNVNLQIPKVPNLPVPVAGLSVNLPQMPSFSTPSWMAAIYDSECVFNAFTWDLMHIKVVLAWKCFEIR